MKLISDPNRCFGDVTLGCTRMTVSTIWGYRGDVDRFMREYEYPESSRADVEAVMKLVDFQNWEKKPAKKPPE